MAHVHLMDNRPTRTPQQHLLKTTRPDYNTYRSRKRKLKALPVPGTSRELHRYQLLWTYNWKACESEKQMRDNTARTTNNDDKTNKGKYKQHAYQWQSQIKMKKRASIQHEQHAFGNITNKQTADQWSALFVCYM